MTEEVFTLKTAPKNIQYKWKYLFGNLKYDKMSKIKMDTTSTFSVTDYQTADLISEIILKLHGINKNSIIVDGTSCVGGNVISFAKNFKYVYAIEMNKNRINILKHNVNIYELNKKIKILNGDVTLLYKNIPIVDIYFLDPPWGGITYKNTETVDLYLSNIHLAEFCLYLKDYTKYIVLKLPKNFNEENFKNIINNQDIINNQNNKNNKKSKVKIYEIHRLKKMIIIILKIKN